MELLALLNDVPIGLVTQDRHGRATFEYDLSYRHEPSATPLSLSLPLAQASHSPDTVEAVLWGLLPDNEHTLQRWATKFNVSARNPVALLSNVGEDCAGAVQFITPENFRNLASGTDDQVEWLDERKIAARLRGLKRDSGAARRPEDLGQFSLAGAQPKTALIFEDGRWGIPNGRIPTTHILKPPSGEYDGYAENEHFCLSLARRFGMPTCESSVLRFGNEVAICVERYDRILTEGRWWRIHQEDACQALGVMPQIKYQSQGGPSPQMVGALLKQHSSRPADDINRFLVALIFNWLIGGTDAHAKNYSLLLSEGGQARLAPLYDLSSALPYPALQRQRIKLAMRVGSHYRWNQVRAGDWVTLSNELGVEPDITIEAFRLMATGIGDEAVTVAGQLTDQGLRHPVIGRLVDSIAGAARTAVTRFRLTDG